MIRMKYKYVHTLPKPIKKDNPMGQKVWFTVVMDYSKTCLPWVYFDIAGSSVSFCSLNKNMPVSLIISLLPLDHSSISFSDLPLSHGLNFRHSVDFSNIL